jgi:hypothetical protein
VLQQQQFIRRRVPIRCLARHNFLLPPQRLGIADSPEPAYTNVGRRLVHVTKKPAGVRTASRSYSPAKMAVASFPRVARKWNGFSSRGGKAFAGFMNFLFA